MIKKTNTRWCRRRALRAVCQFGPWILISLLLAAMFGQADSAALAGLFQSPAEQTATAEAMPTLPATAEATATITPTIEATPTLTPTVEPTPTLEPTSTPEPEPTATPLPMPDPLEEPTITDTLPVDTTGVELDSSTGPGRYPDEESNVEFEWGMLFDSVALGLSYVWLCCGALFILLLPLLFLAFWVAARRRRRLME